MGSFTPILRLLPLVLISSLLWAQPVVSQLLGPNLEPLPNLAPGGVFVVQGESFAGEIRLASVPPLPTRLSGTRVLIDGVECPLLLMTPTTIYAQVPFGTQSKSADGTVIVTVKSAAGESSATATMGKTQPVLLTQTRDGKGAAVMVDDSLRPIVSPRAGDIVIFYLMGLGETTPAGATGLPGSAVEPYQAPNEQVEVYIGDQPAEMLFIGLAPGLAATYQLKVRVPDGGGTMVRVVTEGRLETSAALPVAPLANVTGSVQSVGVPAKAWGFSPIFVGGHFLASMVVPPAMQPFDVVLDHAGGAQLAKITVNPADGTWSGTAKLPDLKTRNLDFNNTGLQAINLLAGGAPTPGNVIAFKLIPPEYQAAFQLMPLPNGPSAGGVGTFTIRGEIPTTGQLDLNLGGGVWQVVAKDAKTYPVTLRLTINGTVVATQDVTIPLQ
ncbi:MAG: hypothetical protein NTY38_14350 [Acidobacteria bacterium]|nr:hypothetical protein [Acidobacteriota bacterium]